MASFGKTPDRPADDGPSFKEVGISVSCEECGERVPKSKYYPSARTIVFECSNGHKGAIQDFVLDIV